MIDPTQAPGSPQKPLDQNVTSFRSKEKPVKLEDLKKAQITRQPATYEELNSAAPVKNTQPQGIPVTNNVTKVVVNNGTTGGTTVDGLTGAAGIGIYNPAINKIVYGGGELYAINASGRSLDGAPTVLFIFARGTTDTAFILRVVTP